MTGKRNQSALLAKYYGLYKKNPRSKVFAPLAEAFRKLGMMDDALKILKEGIRQHPNYALGYIVLAHCYYDQGKFELTYNTLRPIISQNADNVSLQKIFAQACIHLGHLEEALDTYKYLLFLSPRDKFFASEVKKLEDDLMVGHKKLTLDQLIKSPDMIVPVSDTVDDDWVQVDFNRTQKKALPEAAKETESHEDEWIMERPGAEENSGLHPILNTSSVPERSLDDEFFADEFEDEMGNIDENNSTISSDSPIVSHTLIDLYCSQQYFDKAIELLEKILELNPLDQNSIKKLNEVRELKLKHASKGTEESGHDELISIIESKVKVKSPAEIKVKEAFDQFLVDLRDRAQQV